MKRTKKIALSGLILAAAVILTTLESTFFSFLPSGIRIGLANVAVMLAVLTVDVGTAFSVTVLKSLFVALTRGVTAGLMSISGGLPAFIITVLLLKKTKASYIMISAAASICHTSGQIVMLYFMTGNILSFGYLPVLMITSVVSGALTGTVLKITLPSARKAINNFSK